MDVWTPIKKPLFFLVGAAAMRPLFRAKKRDKISKRFKTMIKGLEIMSEMRDSSDYSEASYEHDFAFL